MFAPPTLRRQTTALEAERREVNWCFNCQRKVGLTRFRCRCRNMFCSMHWYLDRHDCSVDYKAGSRGNKARKSNKTPSTLHKWTGHQIRIQKSQYPSTNSRQLRLHLWSLINYQHRMLLVLGFWWYWISILPNFTGICHEIPGLLDDRFSCFGRIVGSFRLKCLGCNGCHCKYHVLRNLLCSWFCHAWTHLYHVWNLSCFTKFVMFMKLDMFELTCFMFVIYQLSSFFPDK